MIYIIKAVFYLWIFMDISKSETDPRFINKVLLEGNDNVTMNEVLYIVRQRPPNFFFRKPKFDDRLLRLDALTLKNYYHSKGFLDVKINDSFKEIKNFIKENQSQIFMLKVQK